MNYTELFNLVAADNPEFDRILSAAVDKINAPPKVSDADFKKLLEPCTVTEATPASAVLTLDVGKMKQEPQFQAKLGALFDGLAERGGIVDGRKVTLRVTKPLQP